MLIKDLSILTMHIWASNLPSLLGIGGKNGVAGAEKELVNEGELEVKKDRMQFKNPIPTKLVYFC